MHLVSTLATGILVSLSSPATSAVQELPGNALREGQWSAWIKRTGVDYGAIQPRAIAVDQVVFRQGPQDKAPVQLFEERSTGSVRIFLRRDGLLLVQPVAGEPRLYFPDASKPLILHLAPPRKWSHRFSPYANIDHGHLWFLGDILFYGRYAYPGHYLIGFIRIDDEKQVVTENRLCVEVAADRQKDAHARAAEIARPAPIRVGDYVFWKNAGYRNDYYPDAVTGIWKQRKTRVIDLKTGEAIGLEQVPKDIITSNQQTLSEFLED